jgi:hypothetical protein
MSRRERRRRPTRLLGGRVFDGALSMQLVMAVYPFVTLLR